MATLVVRDLETSTELDRSACLAVRGGFGTLVSWDELLSNIQNGNVNSGVDITASGNMFSPQIVTNLALYIPVNTVVQLDLDNIVNTEQIIASQFSGGAA
ncbi:MAG: hypothetical protein AAFZ58_00785 [Pseudomonadota bacterium]